MISFAKSLLLVVLVVAVAVAMSRIIPFLCSQRMQTRSFVLIDKRKSIKKKTKRATSTDQANADAGNAHTTCGQRKEINFHYQPICTFFNFESNPERASSTGQSDFSRTQNDVRIAAMKTHKIEFHRPPLRFAPRAACACTVHSHMQRWDNDDGQYKF